MGPICRNDGQVEYIFDGLGRKKLYPTNGNVSSTICFYHNVKLSSNFIAETDKQHLKKKLDHNKLILGQYFHSLVSHLSLY